MPWGEPLCSSHPLCIVPTNPTVEIHPELAVKYIVQIGNESKAPKHINRSRWLKNSTSFR